MFLWLDSNQQSFRSKRGFLGILLPMVSLLRRINGSGVWSVFLIRYVGMSNNRRTYFTVWLKENPISFKKSGNIGCLANIAHCLHTLKLQIDIKYFRALVDSSLFFCQLTSPTCCSLFRKCTPVNAKTVDLNLQL